jgi:hypothetical protein
MAGLFEEINVNNWWTKAKFDSAVTLLEKEEMIAVDRRVLLVAFPKYFSEANVHNFPRNYNQVIHTLRQFDGFPACSLLDRIFNSFIILLQVLAKRFGKQFNEQLHNSLLNSSPNSSTNSSYISISILSSLLRDLEAKKEGKEEKMRPWPKDFELTEKLVIIGKGFKINPHGEFQKAKDWCLANDREYVDYEAFIRNWFRRAAERRIK